MAVSVRNILVQRILFLLVSVLKEPFLFLHDRISSSVSCALETKASMWLSFSIAGYYSASVKDEMTWLHSHAKTTVKPPKATQNIVQPMLKVPGCTEYLKVLCLHDKMEIIQ